MTGINLRRLSNIDFYCKSELNLIHYKDLTDLIWNTSIDVSSRLPGQLYLTALKIRKCTPLSEINLLSRKLDWLFPLLPLVTIRIIDQGPPACPHWKVVIMPVWSPLLQDWTVSDVSAFPCRLSFHNSWQPFALLEFPPVSALNAVLWSAGNFFQFLWPVNFRLVP